MINLPSAIKLALYLLECAICYIILFTGNGEVIFENLDILLTYLYFNETEPEGEIDTSTTLKNSVMPSLWSSIPALAVWVLALFLVSWARHSLPSAVFKYLISMLDKLKQRRGSIFFGMKRQLKKKKK